jgi:hypothetical protein
MAAPVSAIFSTIAKDARRLEHLWQRSVDERATQTFKVSEGW